MSKTDHRHQVLSDASTVYLIRGMNTPKSLHKSPDCMAIKDGCNVAETTPAIACNNPLCKSCWDMRRVAIARVLDGVIREP